MARREREREREREMVRRVGDWRALREKEIRFFFFFFLSTSWVQLRGYLRTSIVRG